MADGNDLAALHASFVDPPPDSRPMVRWWWFGPEVDRAELTHQLDTMRRGGIGGVEVAVVYPLSASPNRYLSDAFLADLRFAAEEANRLGVRFDLTLGSGWPYGGPHVTPDLAARGLHWERREIGISALELPVPRTWPGDELVAAFVGQGASTERPSAWEMLPVVDETIRVPEGSGPRFVLTAVSRITGQHVKRAAMGAEGAVIDHYSAAATARHIEAVCEPLLRAVPAELVGDVFCDSLEVYESDWTPGLLAEFSARRGYDARPRLWMLQYDAPGSPGFRADFYRTLTELCGERFIDPMRQWAAAHGVRFRIQAYGVPPAGVSTYRYADVFEGESWGWKDIPPTRWASSAAQLYGRTIVSSEVWTFVNEPSFRATPLDLKGEAHEHLLCGVNQLIGHGWPYSPRDADGLGWIFYAGGALDDRNPWWPAAPALNQYLQRLCWLMRQGERISDVAVYTPVRDVFGAIDRGRRGSLDLWRGTRDHIGFGTIRAIRDAGFDFDLFDDDAVEALAPDRFPVVVLPAATDIPARTRVWLESVERAGGRVLALGCSASIGTPLGSPDDLAATLGEELGADVRLDPPHPAIGTVHRRIGELDSYLVVNTGPDTVRFDLNTRARHDRIERWDPLTGEVISRHAGAVPLVLEAYEAAVLVAGDGAAIPGGGVDSPVRAVTHVLDADWSVRFGDSDTAVPVDLPHRWEDDPARLHFSGSATYSTSIELDQVPANAALELGPATAVSDHAADTLGMIRHVLGQAYRADIVPPVGEVAEVVVNGGRAGVLWSPPYRLAIADQLRPGRNDIEITVWNTAANALAVDQSMAALVERTEQQFGRRFGIRHVDKAMDRVNSGLLATPRLLGTA